MIAYILSRIDLSVKDCVPISSYTNISSLDFKDKTTIVCGRQPTVTDEDFVLVSNPSTSSELLDEDGNNLLDEDGDTLYDIYTDIIFSGIAETVTKSNEQYTLSVIQMENLLDRQLFLTNESYLETGIEDFLAKTITDNWKSGDTDTRFTYPYLSVRAATHNPYDDTIDESNGTYSFKTLLSNVVLYNDVRLVWSFSKDTLSLKIMREPQEVTELLTSQADISTYTETKSTSVLARLNVKYKNTTSGTTAMKYYVLRTNNTLSQDTTLEDRATGDTKSVYIEAKTDGEMYEKVKKEFDSNKFEHKVTVSIRRDGLRDWKFYHLGKKMKIKTDTDTTYRNSVVSKVTDSSDSEFVTLEFGTMANTLIDKIRTLVSDAKYGTSIYTSK